MSPPTMTSAGIVSSSPMQPSSTCPGRNLRSPGLEGAGAPGKVENCKLTAALSSGRTGPLDQGVALALCLGERVLGGLLAKKHLLVGVAQQLLDLDVMRRR